MLRSLSLFKPAARYPADPRVIFMLVVSTFTGMLAVALDAAPPTIAETLPAWGVIVWSIFLVAGSVATLVGMTIPNLNGILLEQIGSVTIAVSTGFYAVVAFNQLGADALQPVGVVGAWGLACALRWVQLQLLIAHAYRRVCSRE